MAHAAHHFYDMSPEEALREIKAERSRRSWLALFLFVLSAGGIAVSFYYSYRGIPAPSSPANNAPVLLDPYH
jgi:hypothetical protein